MGIDWQRAAAAYAQGRRLKERDAGPAWAPTVVKAPSPNHGGVRASTLGCVIHSTRGGTSSPEREYQATVNWFANPSSGVSAHIVIRRDGLIAECVNPSLVAWHDPSTNATHLGVELCQSRIGDPISDQQLAALAWWLNRMSERFQFPLDRRALPEHRETTSGLKQGKSDVGPPYSFERLAAFL